MMLCARYLPSALEKVALTVLSLVGVVFGPSFVVCIFLFWDLLTHPVVDHLFLCGSSSMHGGAVGVKDVSSRLEAEALT